MTPDSLMRLAAIGSLLAAVPLAFWLMRCRGLAPRQRLARLTALTLFLTLDLIAFGAYTRLSDSGLGCPDWPGCYGLSNPQEASHHIEAAEAVMPSGPVTWAKAWVEMIHRYFAMAVGLLILLAALAAWRHRKLLPHGPGWAWLTLGWVILQGLFGKYTVTLKLYPAIVTLHLLGAVLLLALLSAQHAWFRQTQLQAPQVPLAWRKAGIAVALVLLVQVALGGWVSTNYAVLACQTFPSCNGQWWPEMDWARGFEILRELGLTRDGQALPANALVAIHWTHRLFAVVAALAVGLLAWKLACSSHSRPWGKLLLGLLGLQLLTGVSNVVLQWPLAAALLHTSGAAALVATLVHWLASCQTPRLKSAGGA